MLRFNLNLLCFLKSLKAQNRYPSQTARRRLGPEHQGRHVSFRVRLARARVGAALTLRPLRSREAPSTGSLSSYRGCSEATQVTRPDPLCTGGGSSGGALEAGGRLR